jgi:peptidoglycan/LPS O-acetylase OafA/YrhL
MVLSALLKPFSRITSSGRFIPEIDGMRFVAIGLVVLFHLRSYSLWVRPAQAYAINANQDWLARLTSHGYYGVQFFFVISGFILALPFAARWLDNSRPVRLSQYYLRRVTRLEPPYILCMIGLFLWLAVFASSWSLGTRDMTAVPTADRAAALLPSLLASLVYQHNLIFSHESYINFVAWSLEIEVQFYLLVPLLVVVFRVHSKLGRRTIILAVAVAVTLLQVFMESRIPILHLTILGHLQFFLLGFLLADIYLADWRNRPGVNFLWDVAALAAWVGLFLVWERNLLVLFLMPPLIMIIYMAAFRGRISNRIFRHPMVVTIGGMCYSIYLLHPFLVSRIARFTDRFILSDYFFGQYLARMVAVVPLLLILTGIYFVLIERPCMKRDWPQRLWQKLRRS